MRLFRERAKLVDADSRLLVIAFYRARAMHRFFLTAWVFLPDHLHAIYAPVYPLMISLVVKSIKASGMLLIDRWQHESGGSWQVRFFDRAVRTVREYNEKEEPSCFL